MCVRRKLHYVGADRDRHAGGRAAHQRAAPRQPQRAAVFFVGGLFISEVMFGWATKDALQPNIDGLSFDEVLLGYVFGVPIVWVARYLTRRRQLHRPAAI